MQLSLSVKSPLAAMFTVCEDPVLFVSTITFAALVVPTTWLAKVSEVGESPMFCAKTLPPKLKTKMTNRPIHLQTPLGE